MVCSRTLLASVILACFMGSVRAAAAPMACEDLRSLSLPQTTIALAQSVAPGAFTPPVPAWAQAFMHAKPVPVAFCRVTGSIRPTADSDIRFEVWLPESGWTGRYESVGNGGFAGFIRYDSMVKPLLGGSVVASTDDGHDAPAIGPTAADWALGHPEKVIDYGYRAVHLTAVVAKSIATSRYGRAPSHAYFVGCSKGGQEGLMESQRYPEDFDGIVSGAAASDWTHLFTSFVWAESVNLATHESYLSVDDLQKIDKSVMAACGLAGDRDNGFLSDPLRCHIDARSIGLSAAGLRTFQAIHRGPHTADGRLSFPGQPYGSEKHWIGIVSTDRFESSHTDAQMSMYGGNFFRNFIYQDRHWRFDGLDLQKAQADADARVGEIMNANDPHLPAFKARGGKLITYAGMTDAVVTPLSSLSRYQAAVSALGGSPATALTEIQKSYRLFLAPGVGHCGGGPGPNEFGQAGGAGDAEHDMVVALERWVEQGVAPSQIVATKYRDDEPSRGVAMTRPLCPYPQVATYLGSGSSTEASSFACEAR